MGQNVQVNVEDGGDDWETDPDFEVASVHFLHPSSQP